MNLDQLAGTAVEKFINNIQANVLNLVAAIGLERPVSVVYTDLDGVTSIRLIQPNAIVLADNGQTVVKAFDLNRQEARTLRVASFEYVAAPGEDLGIETVIA